MCGGNRNSLSTKKAILIYTKFPKDEPCLAYMAEVRFFCVIFHSFLQKMKCLVACSEVVQ